MATTVDNAGGPGHLSLSVAMCTHNGERFVVQQLRSILDQTMPVKEIVVSDDASRDGTVDLVLATFANWQHAHPERDTVLHVLKNPTALGVTANFEQAIMACSGDLIALSDQDDIWVGHRLERVAELFGARPDLLLLHGDATLVDAAGAGLGMHLFDALGVSRASRDAIHDGRAFEVLMTRNVVTGATTVFRRSLLAHAAPFPSAWLHDEWLAVVAAAVGEVDFVPDPLVLYRQHGSNEIGADRLSLAGRLARLFEPGAQRNARLLARAQALADWIGAHNGVSPEFAVSVAQKLQHEKVRSSLPISRARRLVPVLRELGSHRYSLFGRGLADAARDLFQPRKAAR